MTPHLNKPTERLPDSLGKPYREDSDAVRECGEVLNYGPEDGGRPEGAGALRYVAIRVRKRQGQWFAEGSEGKHFAVASKPWDWAAPRFWRCRKSG